MRSPFRRKNLSPRLLPFYLVAALAFWLAEPTPGRFALGGAFVLALFLAAMNLLAGLRLAKAGRVKAHAR